MGSKRLKFTFFNRLKEGDIAIAIRSGNLVKILSVHDKDNGYEEHEEERTILFLRQYWHTNHGVILPKKFKIVEARFTSSQKIYEYPKLKKCLRKIKNQEYWKTIFESKTIK